MDMIGIVKGSLVDWVYVLPFQFYIKLNQGAHTPILIASR